MARVYDKNKPSQYDDLIRASADRHGLDPELFRKLIWIESDFNPNAQSPTGPKGLAQFTKATGRNMGLRIDGFVDERLDPEKALDASARHLADLYKQANGDPALMGLMYNQGNGKLGRPQIEAYKRGDYSKISKEGLKYMETLAGFTTNPLEQPAGQGVYDQQGITPSADPFYVDNINNTNNKKAIDSSVPTLESIPTMEINKNTEHYFYGYDDEQDVGFFEGTGKAIRANLMNSYLGQVVQSMSADGPNPFTSIGQPSYELNTKELQQAKDAGVKVDYLNVLSRAVLPEDVPRLIEQALKNQKEDEEAATSGLGAQLVGGIGGALADPLTYLPIVGWGSKAASWGTKAANVGVQTGIASAGGEYYRQLYAGGVEQYANAFFGGLVMGSSFSALGHVYRNYKGFGTGVDETSSRALARQTAMDSNLPDNSKFDFESLEFDQVRFETPEARQAHIDSLFERIEGANLEFMLHPTEHGAVVLRDGTIISNSNPMNPLTLRNVKELDVDSFNLGEGTKFKFQGKDNSNITDTEEAIPKANWGVKLGGLTEASQYIMESVHENVRALGRYLVRPQTGYKDKDVYSSMTVSDIVGFMRQHNHVDFEKMENNLNEAIKTELGYTKGLTKDEAIENITRRIAEHMETGKGVLSDVEMRLKENLQDFFKKKEGHLMRPSKFGNAEAKPLMESTHFKDGNYFPVRYVKAKLEHWKRILGGEEQLQQALIKAYLMSDDKHINEVINVLKQKGTITEGMSEAEINAAVHKYANDTAFGISSGSKFRANSKVDEVKEGLVGIDNNDYLEARHLFDNSSTIQVRGADGKMYDFSPNDLRSWDMMDVVGTYAMRVDGDIAIMGATGKTTREIKDEITYMRMEADRLEDAKYRRDVEALEQMIILATGRSRTSTDGLAGEALNGLNNLVLASNGYYIPALNFSEIAGMFAMKNVSGIIRQIPVLRNLVAHPEDVGIEELKDLNRALFGKELTTAFRNSRQSIIDRIERNTGNKRGAELVGSFKYATQELGDKLWWVKAIPATTNTIIDTARMGFLGDIAGDIVEGVGTKGAKWDRPELLRAAGLTQEQWDGAKALLREHMEVQPNGTYAFKNLEGMLDDTRAYDLWRYGDYAAKEAILFTHRLDSQTLKQYGAFVRTALFFKNFIMRSMNGRTMHDFWQATRNERALEKASSLMIGMGLSTLVYAATTHMRAFGLPEGEREEYLRKAFQPETLTWNAATRTSQAGFMGVANVIGSIAGFDAAQTIRTTQSGVQKPEKIFEKGLTGHEMASRLGSNVMMQIPAVGFGAEVGAAIGNIFNYNTDDNYVNNVNSMNATYNNLKRILPNDPLIQQAYIQLWMASGLPYEPE